ncbi:MAG: methyltransferase domain-containing protein [Armatimonadetes bacterium]|nr:methyltransferase domain-containing protein [Armatimonadota bacterium]
MDFSAQTVLFAPEMYKIEKNSLVLFLDPEAPNWIAADQRGSLILSYVNGKNTLLDVALSYSRELKLDPPRAWIEAQEFLREVHRKGFLSNTPFVRAPYTGRKNYLRAEQLDEFWIHLNNSCNLTCAHCLVNSSPREDKGLPLETLRRAVQEARGLGVSRFYLTGGEPFLRPDIFRLIEEIGAEEELVILTNGVLLRGEVLRKLKSLRHEGLKLQISLDGSCPEVNDAIRGKGSFRRIAAGIREAVSLNLLSSVTTTIMHSNLHDLPSVVATAASLGARQLHLLWLHRRGRARDGSIPFEVPSYQLVAALQKVESAAAEFGISVDNLKDFSEKVTGPRGLKRDLSNACYSSLCLYSDGKIYPSAALANIPDLCCGDFLTMGLEEIWRNSSLCAEFRDATLQKKSLCHSCHLKFLCGGGDMEHSYLYSRVHSSKGSLNAMDPYCELYKHQLEKAMLDNALESRKRFNSRSGFSRPTVYHAMGDDRRGCSPNGRVHYPDEYAVETLHSNCVLPASLERSRSIVREFYARAAVTPQKDLCCAGIYSRKDTSHIPKEVIERFYGCGSPIHTAKVSEGEVVVDLGSGAGIDCFIAAKRVGAGGKVIGVDMTDEMLDIANQCKKEVRRNLGFNVVEFRKGYLEDLPIEGNTVDVVTSNCVINLSPDKNAVFQEMWRILKDHGRMVVSDIVADREVPPHLRTNAQLWGECISGALTEEEFLASLERAGFYGVCVLNKSFYKEVEGHRFHSVTVRGYKYEKKKGCVFLGQRAVYRGPFKAVVDEEGHFFPRNEMVEVCTDTAAKILNGPYQGAFVVTDADGESSAALCDPTTVEDCC